MVVLANEVSSTLSIFRVDASVLDITLANIKALNAGNRNRVDWNTADEQQGDVFELEKSKNGTGFSHLATIAAKGQPSAYNFWDEQPAKGWNYYRLKMKHTSGSVSYSPVVSAFVKNGLSVMQLYPNPATETVILRINSNQPANGRIQVLDANGAVIRDMTSTGMENPINITSLPAGVYTVRYSKDSFTESLRFTKQ
jgi:hypothetical protein